MDAQDYKIQAQLGNKYPDFQRAAGIMQHGGMSSENLRIANGQLDYSENQVRVATVHTREDGKLKTEKPLTGILTGKGLDYCLP